MFRAKKLRISQAFSTLNTLVLSKICTYNEFILFFTSVMSLLTAYHQLLDDRQWIVSDDQVACLEALAQHTLPLRTTRSSWRGAYLYGPAGVGKTVCANLMTQQNNLRAKRIHFHAFMIEVHQTLNQLHRPNPLQHIAASWAKDYDVLLLDEFLILDIADAMIIQGLCQALSDAHVYVITTSNLAPNQLYPDGPNREAFLAFITWCQKHWQCIPFTKADDLRRQHSQTQLGQYWVSEDPSPLIKTMKAHHITVDQPAEISLNQRSMPVLAYQPPHVWFRFAVLCGPPRAVIDYHAMAKHGYTVWLSEVPPLRLGHRILRFMQWIDICYEYQIPLYIQAQVGPDDLCQNPQYQQRFARTSSRLHALTDLQTS